MCGHPGLQGSGVQLKGLAMRRLLTIASLLSVLGCKVPDPTPATAGVSRPLQYPVLLIGQASLDVRDSEMTLTSITGASSLNLNERVILDSAGHLYKVTGAAPIAGQPSPMLSMGTSTRRYAVTVEDTGQPAWRDVQSLVLAEVRNPRSTWAGDERAIRRVQALRDVASLIAACREGWSWTQEPR